MKLMYPSMFTVWLPSLLGSETGSAGCERHPARLSSRTGSRASDSKRFISTKALPCPFCNQYNIKYGKIQLFF